MLSCKHTESYNSPSWFITFVASTYLYHLNTLIYLSLIDVGMSLYHNRGWESGVWYIYIFTSIYTLNPINKMINWIKTIVFCEIRDWLKKSMLSLIRGFLTPPHPTPTPTPTPSMTPTPSNTPTPTHPLRRRYFQMHFREWNVLCFN